MSVNGNTKRLRLSLVLDEEMTTAVVRYTRSLGLDPRSPGSIPDVIRELLLVAFSSEPQLAAIRGAQLRAADETRRYLVQRIDSFCSELREDVKKRFGDVREQVSGGET